MPIQTFEKVESFQKSTACRNCQTSLAESHYCPNCGQKQALRLNLKRLFRRGFKQIMSLDSALARTFIGLSLRPGKICRAYISGKRAPFYNPPKYAFLLITSYLLIVTFFSLDMTGDMLGGSGELLEKQQKIFNFILGLSGYLFFLYNFPAAKIHQWLFKKSGIQFAEAYVFGLYIGGHVVLFNILFAISGLAATRAGFLAIALIHLTYTVWALTDFYNSRSFRIIFKGIVYYIFFRIFQIIAGIIAVLIGRWLNYI